MYFFGSGVKWKSPGNHRNHQNKIGNHHFIVNLMS